MERSVTQDNGTLRKQRFGAVPGVAPPSGVRDAPTDRAAYRVATWPDEDGRIVAKCVDINGVASDGEDMDAALANVTEAISAYLESEGETKGFSLIVEPA